MRSVDRKRDREYEEQRHEEEDSRRVLSSHTSDSGSGSEETYRSKKKKKRKLKKEENKKKSKKKCYRKKDKKEKKKRKKLKGDDDVSLGDTEKLELDMLDAKEIAEFKLAVESRKNGKSYTQHDSDHQTTMSSSLCTSDIFASTSDIMSKYGISKGLIRTAETGLSISQTYSKNLFGDHEVNPATRQRMKREQAAQRAMDKARKVIKSRQAGTAVVSNCAKDTSNVCDLSANFRSGT